MSPISKLHSVDVVDGEFRGTTPADLAQLFEAVEASAGRDHLVVHLHGGLVSRAAAEGIAQTLLPDYLDCGGYPVFFIWNSDPLSVLANSLDQVAQEPVFRRLVRRLVQMLAGKLAETVGMRGLQIEIESLKDIPVDPEALLEWTREREPAAADDVAELTATQRDQIERELRQDAVIREESRGIAAGLLQPEEIEREIATRARGGPPPRASRKTLMSASVLKRIAEESPEPGTRSVATLAAIAKYGVEIAIAVIARYRKRRDHGLMATVAEEVARTLYADSIGGTVWALMKGEAKDAFGGDPRLHGGTAFIDHLAKWWKPGRRVTLVGHSTGAIYAMHLLEHADAALPAEAKFDVVFLAPACTFEFMHERLSLLARRVSGFRMFALSEALERGYWEVPVLYPASLLYMVSGLFEEPEVDMPIVGMQRYFELTGPYDQPEIRAVAEWVSGRCIWAVAAGTVGLQSGALKHGAFDEDVETRNSLKHILRSGF